MADEKVDLVPFADGSNKEEIDWFIMNDFFPCVVKPRFSSGSRSIKIVKNKTALLKVIKEIEKPVIQRYIDDEYGEFSVGVFASNNHSSALAFRRKLGPKGASWYADNMESPDDVLDYAYKISAAIELKGSCNIQLRKSSIGVRLL